jgi:dinuclear metal center YbgI/SA1388 family protein
LVERHVYTVDVIGSSPVGPTRTPGQALLAEDTKWLAMVSLEVLIQTFEKLWPKTTADDWDRPGLAFGSKHTEISKVLLSVDLTAAVLNEAKDLHANLVLAHHPPLLRGVSELGDETIKGNLASNAIRNQIAVFSAHTNSDKAEIGTARALASALGVEIQGPLDEASGHGFIAKLASPESLISFSTRLAKILPSVAAGIKVAGDPEMQVRSIAVAPGAGDSFLANALAAGVDVFITSDLRHHPAQDFIESNEVGQSVALIDISHWAAESLWLPLAQKELTRLHPDVEFLVSEIRTDPWDFAVMQ